MRAVALSVLLAAGAALAIPAYAQEAPADTGQTPGDGQIVNQPPDPGWMGNPVLPCCDVSQFRGLGQGVAALEASDFVQAEKIFDGILLYNRNNPSARFYMGVAKMNLGKWDEAKRYLVTPARVLRTLPDPKSRLGVTYAKLGDIAGANAQRAQLVEMSEACKGDCKLSPYITAGIEMIDKAIAEARPSMAEPSQG